MFELSSNYFKWIAVYQIFLYVLVSTQTTYYVAKLGLPSNTSCTESSPCLTIQQAATLAATGDIIFIEAGAYGGNGNVNVEIPPGVNVTGSPETVQTIVCDGEKDFALSLSLSSISNLGFSNCRIGVHAFGGGMVWMENVSASEGYNLITAENLQSLSVDYIIPTSHSAPETQTQNISMISVTSTKKFLLTNSVLHTKQMILAIDSTEAIISNITSHITTRGAESFLVASNSDLFLTRLTFLPLSNEASIKSPLFKTSFCRVRMQNISATNLSYFHAVMGQREPQGLYAFANSSIIIENSNFSNNSITAKESPFSLIELYNSSVSFQNTTLSNNDVPGGSSGLFLCIENSVVTLLSSQLISNTCGFRGFSIANCIGENVIEIASSEVYLNPSPLFAPICLVNWT